MFSHKSLGFQMLIVTMILLLIPVCFILYDIHFAGKKEEITFIAKEERLGTMVKTVSNDMHAQIFVDELNTPRQSPEEFNQFLGQIFRKSAGPMAELNPGVRLGLFIPEGNELLVEGFLHEYRKLTKQEQRERESKILANSYNGIQSVLASGQPLATISGERDNRFLENFVPIRFKDEIVAVLWADERLHPIFSQARKFRMMTRYGSLVAILIGFLGVFAIISKLTSNVRIIKRGLEGLEHDINNLLPSMPGEMGQIVGAINKMAQAVAEKERLEEEMRNQERLASLGQVVTGVAHELRNPLGIIKTSVQLMEGETKDSALHEYCQVIKQQVDRQNKVITELLAYGRPSKPVNELVQINMLLDSVLTFTASQLRQKKINLITNYNNNLPPVYGDAERLKQVFVNIILNSIAAMPTGGTLKISSDLCQQKIIVKFVDNGVGIKEEDKKHIFDPFFTTKHKGTGLGLTICKQIITIHKGDILVEDNEAGGTTFTVTIPSTVNKGE